MNRQELEDRARACCPTDMVYDLRDTIAETPDADLHHFIEENEISPPLFAPQDLPDHAAPVTLADFAAVGDKVGVIRRLRSLRGKGLALDQEVLQAGFTMIGQHHGIEAVIMHVLGQFKDSQGD